MGRVTYEYGYRVALARFRARYPDADVEEDPFTIHPEDDLVPMERQQDFDDSLDRMSGDSELGSESRLLEWWSSGREEVLQLGSAADSCKKVGSGAYIVGVVDHPYLATRLPLWLTLSLYASITPVVLAVRDASTGEGIGLTCVRSIVRFLGYRPYLCQVDRMTTGAPIPASDQLTVLGRPHR
ncbi:hypothetical protein BHM03_00043869 [Ensete ventricosum]|nr:hypothetical protein BHM03_00043869 [Ensete ventricosum]